MSYAWDRTHRRYQLAHLVADDVARRGADALADWSGDIESAFGDLDGFLRDVQRRWYSAFDTLLDEVLAAGPDDIATELKRVWAEVAAANHSYRVLLDALSAHPVLAEGEAHHRRRLVAATGADPRRVPWSAA